jgi:hypothetical protein
MPPTTASSTEYVLRAYLQYHNWVMLDTSSRDPLDYGWELTSVFQLKPTYTKAEIASEVFLNLICCYYSVFSNIHDYFYS